MGNIAHAPNTPRNLPNKGHKVIERGCSFER